MARPSDQDKEEKALDALMAAAFRLGGRDEPVTEEEAERLVRNPPELSSEDKAAIDSLEPDFVEHLLKQSGSGEPAPPGAEPVLDEELEDALAAMHRGKEGEELSDEARREIERKRRELLGEPEPETETDEENRDGA